LHSLAEAFASISRLFLVVPCGIVTLYLPSCSGKTLRDDDEDDNVDDELLCNDTDEEEEDDEGFTFTIVRTGSSLISDFNILSRND
jgi:hypothetical protein